MTIAAFLRRGKGIYVPPLLSFGLIYLDIRHTRRWKNGQLPAQSYIIGAPPPPRKATDIHMGTFTWSLWARRHVITQWKGLLAASIVMWSVRCIDNTYRYRSTICKGQSQMYKSKIARVPEGEDPWKW